MRSETIGMRKRPVAVVEEGPGVSADVKSRVAVAFIGRERRRLQIGNLLCKNPRVACGFHIMRNRIREPDEIVRTPGPHAPVKGWMPPVEDVRSAEHTSELQSLMRISYAVFCLKKKNHPTQPYQRQ